MRRLILAVMCSMFVVPFIVSCKGESSEETLADKYLKDENQPKYPHAYVFTIIGKVVCPACKAENVLTMGIEDDNGVYLLDRPYVNSFGDGSYKMTDITLEAGDKILFRAYVDGVYPIGKPSEFIEVPDEDKAIEAPTITIP